MMRFKIRQWHVYALLWLWVLVYPILNRALTTASEFSWSDVWVMWINTLPFLILFLIHNYLIVPLFPLPKKIVPYLCVTIVLLGCFTLVQYLRMEPRFHDMKWPHPEMTLPMGAVPPPEFAAPDGANPPSGKKAPDGIRRARPERMGPPGEIKPPPRRAKSPGYIMDCVIALLMLGCNQTIVLAFRMQKQQEKVQQMEKESLQHELDYLKAQIKPHFLMNMLNNIHSMIEVDPERAQDMVINLSKLLRYTLYEGGRKAVFLSQEIAFISDYITMMQQRCSGRKVTINLSLPDRVSDKILVPPLLFIVFIENAFKHGISYRKASYINVSLSVTQDDRIDFTCENSIPPAREDKEDRSASEGGIGLENVRKRLGLLFGSDYELDIQPTKDAYTVKLNIPGYDEKYTLPGS